MRGAIKRKADAAIAVIMAIVFALSLSGVPASALADADSTDNSTDAIYVQGIDFMQPTAEGLELIKVENLGDRAIYLTIYKDGVKINNPMKYTAQMNGEADGPSSGAQVAQVVAAQILNNDGTAQSVYDLFGNASSTVPYKIEVTDAFMDGNTLYSGQIYPVYGDIVGENGTDRVLLGIRTANDDEAKSLKNFGIGQSYYKQDSQTDDSVKSFALQTIKDEAGKTKDYTFNGNSFVITYTQNDESTIFGSVTYVDDATGEVVKTETFSGIGQEPKTVGIKKSFTAVDDDTQTTKYYRAISALSGTEVALSITNPNHVVRVVEVEGMDASSYTVTVKYLDEKDNLLWSEDVNVLGYGYRYTLPNTFSMNKGSKVDSADGVNFYRLNHVVGGKVADASNNSGIVTASEATEEGDDSNNADIPDGESGNTTNSPAISNASSTNGTALVLTGDLLDANFVMENGKRVVEAVYHSQDATKEVDFTLVEIDGQTGDEIGRVTQTLTPDASTNFSYTPANKVVNGKTYVPWGGNTKEITYTWESLGQGVDLLQYVYYVPEDYKPGNPYDITVQYMNIANGQILRSETHNVDPEITNYVEVVGEPRFTQDGNTYVRLAGQDSGIRHAYFSPDRTYTIYYRDVNDTINANTTITRTQIIETERTVVVPGGGLTAAPVAVDAAAGEPGADAGVGAGDGTVIINDDDNPLANFEGQDTSSERTIEENENPLAKPASSGAQALAIATAIAAAGLIGFLIYYRYRRRKFNDALKNL